jgi:hypothetical protein
LPDGSIVGVLLGWTERVEETSALVIGIIGEADGEVRPAKAGEQAEARVDE